MVRQVLRWVAALLIVLVPGAAAAQALACDAAGADLSDTRAGDAPSSPRQGEERRLMPVAGYTLALTWSPEFCRTRTDSPRDAFQCARAQGGQANGRRFGFTLHGLWPDGAGGQWPQYCHAVTPLPTAIVRRNLCAMPSAALQQHEWAKHGSCASADPARFFADATRLYAGLHYPDMDALSRGSQTTGSLARAFAAANPGLPVAAVKVVANRRGWLDEVRLCLDRGYRAVVCPAEQHASYSGPVQIWRGGSVRGRYTARAYTSERSGAGRYGDRSSAYPRSWRSRDDADRGGAGQS